jgi:hypothetical protein
MPSADRANILRAYAFVHGNRNGCVTWGGTLVREY